MDILCLDLGKIIENDPELGITDFSLLLDLCFEISDYFTLTVHNHRTIYSHIGEEFYGFFREMKPYLLKKIKAVDWGIYGIMNPSADVYIFKCDIQAKSVIQKYFDNLYLRVQCAVKRICGKVQDLCFFKQNDMIFATISHENMCDVYPPNEKIKNKFLEICEWNVFYKNFNKLKYPVEDILFGASYKSHPFYLFLQSIRKQVIYRIREKSLERLYYYVKGYCDREVNTADRRMCDMLMLIDDFFLDFVCSYYDIKDEINHGKHWSEIITEKNISHEEAFDKFYVLFDDFLDKNWTEYEKEFSFLLN